MEQQLTRNNHYVPAWYQRQFLISNESKLHYLNNDKMAMTNQKPEQEADARDLRQGFLLAAIAAGLNLLTLLIAHEDSLSFCRRRSDPLMMLNCLGLSQLNIPLVIASAVLGIFAYQRAGRLLGATGPLHLALLATLLLIPPISLLPLASLLWRSRLAICELLDKLPPESASTDPGSHFTSVPNVPFGPVLPRIKTQAFVKAAAALPEMTQHNLPLVEDIAGDLVVSFAIDAGDHFVTLSNALCAQMKIPKDELLRRALENADEALKTLQLKEDGPVSHIIGTDGSSDMEACIILVRLIWDAAALHLQDAPVMIVPHRNAVHYTAANSLEGVTALRRIIASTDFNDRHALSRNLYIWKDRKWGVFEGT